MGKAENNDLKVKDLKEFLKGLPDDMDISLYADDQCWRATQAVLRGGELVIADPTFYVWTEGQADGG